MLIDRDEMKSLQRFHKTIPAGICSIDDGGEVPGGTSEADLTSSPADLSPDTLTESDDRGGSTVLDPKPDGSAQATTYFADDWRTQMVDKMGLEGDEKDGVLKQLERVTSPEQVVKRWMDGDKTIKDLQQNRMPTLPEDATEEQLSAYREEMGVPQTVEGYMEGLPEGVVLSEADTAIAQDFHNFVHGLNMPKQYASMALSWYQGYEQKMAQLKDEMDGELRQDTENKLREEWGNADYVQNINLVKAMLNGFPEDARAAVATAINPATGLSIMNDPGVLKGMAEMARQANPVGVILDASVPTDKLTLDEEIKKIEQNEIGKGDWYKNDARQKQYRQLLQQRDRVAASAG